MSRTPGWRARAFAVSVSLDLVSFWGGFVYFERTLKRSCARPQTYTGTLVDTSRHVARRRNKRSAAHGIMGRHHGYGLWYTSYTDDHGARCGRAEMLSAVSRVRSPYLRQIGHRHPAFDALRLRAVARKTVRCNGARCTTSHKMYPSGRQWRAVAL